MNRHISTEALSAYLDYQVDPRSSGELDSHLAACEQCRAHLDSLRGVVAGLSQVTRVAPPLGLAQRIRHQVAAEPVSPWRRFRDFVLAVPRRPDLRTHCAMAMALVVSVFLVGHGIERKQREILARQQQDPRGKVTAYAGDNLPPDWSKPITIVLGGREFVWTSADRWTGADVWVEKGVDPLATQATTKIDTHSPRGQEILKSSFGEEDRVAVAAALEHGSRMVLQVNASPVELSTQQL